MATPLPEPRVRDFFIGPADEDKRAHQGDDRDRRPREPPPGRANLARDPQLVKHAAPRKVIGIAEAEERCTGFGNDRPGDVEGGVKQQKRQDVGHDVPVDDPEIAAAPRLGGLDELALLERERLGAHHARGGAPDDQHDGQDDKGLGAAEECDQHDDEGQERHAVDDVGEAHEGFIQPAAVIAREQPDIGPDDD